MQLGESQLAVADNPQIGPLQLTIGYKRAGEGITISVPPELTTVTLPEEPVLIPPPPKIEIPVKEIIHPPPKPKREEEPAPRKAEPVPGVDTLEAILNEMMMARMHLNEIRFLLRSINRVLSAPPWYVRLWRWIKAKIRRT